MDYLPSIGPSQDPSPFGETAAPNSALQGHSGQEEGGLALTIGRFKNIPLTQLSDPKEASIFFLGHEHIPEHREVINDLIAHLAKSYNVLLFIEGTESLAPVQNPEAMKTNWYHLDPSLHNSVAIYGWDIDTQKEIKGYDLTSYQLARKAYPENEQKIQKLENILSQIDFNDPKAQEILANLSLAQLHTINKMQNNLDSLYKIQLQLEEILTTGVASQEEIDRTFPMRVDAMVNTIDRIPEIKAFPDGQKKTVAVFVSGYLHVIYGNEVDLNTQRLKPFHETILPRDDAIVLIPQI